MEKTVEGRAGIHGCSSHYTIENPNKFYFLFFSQIFFPFLFLLLSYMLFSVHLAYTLLVCALLVTILPLLSEMLANIISQNKTFQ